MIDLTAVNLPSQQLTPEQLQAQAVAWLHAPVPRLYSNGFAIAQSNADLTLVMLLNGAPTAIANMSFNSAKTLSEELTRAVKALEEAIGQPILTMNELADKLSAAKGVSHDK